MTITVGGTSITFNDATTQTTAPVNTNANVTSVSAGSGISVSATTGAITISATGGGTVTSIATNNGLTGGTITSSGTIGIDIYNGSSYNYSSYAIGTTLMVGFSGTPVNANTSVGISIASGGQGTFYPTSGGAPYGGTPTAISGTWRSRGYLSSCGVYCILVTRTA